MNQEASVFDPDSFMQETTSDQAMDTRIPTVPPKEYAAIIKDVTARQQPKKEDPNSVYTILDVTYSVDDAEAKEATGMDKPTVRQSVFLDITDEGKLDAGKSKNVGLGRLREATGLNEAGQAFSFRQLVGKAVMIRVAHSPNPNDPESPYANVKAVTAIA